MLYTAVRAKMQMWCGCTDGKPDNRRTARRYRRKFSHNRRTLKENRRTVKKENPASSTRAAPPECGSTGRGERVLIITESTWSLLTSYRWLVDWWHLSLSIFLCHQQTWSNEIWHVVRGRWVMHGSMQYDPIQGQGHEPFTVLNPAIFKSCLLHHLQWELATDHRFLN